MANYNYNYSSPFSGFSASPWMQAMQNIPSHFYNLQQGMYNQDPSLALDAFIRTIRSSNTNENLIRQMLPTLRQGWVQQQLTDAQNKTGTLRPFSEYLSNYNWDRELSRMSPDVRRESPSLFQRPVRTITF